MTHQTQLFNNSNFYIINRPGGWYDQIIYAIYRFKGIYWFSIDLTVFIDFLLSSLLDTLECIGRYFFICYHRNKEGIPNVSKYVFTQGFVDVELKKIDTIWFRYKAASLRN